MKKETLFTTVQTLKDASFIVAAIVSDCGGSNQGLWRTLGIQQNSPEFQDSSDAAKKIWVQRQNVTLAAQLLSHTVATALRRYLAEDEEAIQLADFIETINDWFDVVNSRSTNETMDIKKPFELAMQVQNKAQSRMNELMESVQCVGKNSIQVFQKSIIMSKNALMRLYEDMKRTHGIKFIITKHLNQDCLESYFGHIRVMGGMQDHPSPLKALQRMKLITLEGDT